MKPSAPKEAVAIAYGKVPTSDSIYEFEHSVEALQDYLHDAFPSVYACLRWVGKFDCAVASNEFAFFGVSERDGSVSVWYIPKEVKPILKPIRDNWLSQIKKKFPSVAYKAFVKS